MRPTVTEIKQSPLYAIAERNWLHSPKSKKKSSTKKARSSDVITEVYEQYISPAFDYSVLLSLEYLQYLEKYVQTRVNSCLFVLLCFLTRL